VKKLAGGFDNGLGAILIGEHSLASFLSKKSSEISGLFQHYRSLPDSCSAKDVDDNLRLFPRPVTRLRRGRAKAPPSCCPATVNTAIMGGLADKRITGALGKPYAIEMKMLRSKAAGKFGLFGVIRSIVKGLSCACNFLSPPASSPPRLHSPR